MSVVGEALSAIREALKLSDDVKRVGDTLKELSRELRDQDRRIIRLEAKWETAMEFSAARGAQPRAEPRSSVRQIENKG
jgi:predicted  nucleic acid-binding Zn-ribbon protein